MGLPFFRSSDDSSPLSNGMEGPRPLDPQAAPAARPDESSSHREWLRNYMNYTVENGRSTTPETTQAQAQGMNHLASGIPPNLIAQLMVESGMFSDLDSARQAFLQDRIAILQNYANVYREEPRSERVRRNLEMLGAMFVDRRALLWAESQGALALEAVRNNDALSMRRAEFIAEHLLDANPATNIARSQQLRTGSTVGGVSASLANTRQVSGRQARDDRSAGTTISNTRSDRRANGEMSGEEITENDEDHTPVDAIHDRSGDSNFVHVGSELTETGDEISGESPESTNTNGF